MAFIEKLMLVGSKARLNFRSDLDFLCFKGLSISDRCRYLVRKYLALLTLRHHIFYLGSVLHYDNFWTPALLQHYPSEINRLSKIVPLAELRTVLDVGANLGQFAITLKRFFPQLEVSSFEPNQAIFSLLQANANAVSGWRVFPYAVGAQDETLALHYVPGKSCQGSFFQKNAALGLLRSEVVRTEVVVKNLSADFLRVCDLPQKFDLVKIDVEGAERSVLSGLTGVQWKYLYIECSSGREGSISEEEVVGILTLSSGMSVEVLDRTVPRKGEQTYDLVLVNRSFAT